MTDPELVAAAIAALTDGDVATFADLLDHGRVDVYAWRRGATRPSRTVRRLLHVIIAHPRTMRRWLEDAR